MKHKLALFTLYTFAFVSVFAQGPNSINYQAVARNSSGIALQNQSITLQVSILDNTSTGTVVFRERHATSTTNSGLFNVQIGNGSNILGSIAGVQWGNNAKFLKIEIDVTGGTTFVDMGTTQIVSVPYALYANTANTANNLAGTAAILPSQILGGGASSNQVLQWNGTNWVAATIITTISTDNTLTGNGTGGNPLKIGQNSATNGQYLKWNGTAWAPATMDTAVKTDITLTGKGNTANPLKLAQNGATNGQVIKWNGTAWVPSADNNTAYTAGTGLSLTGTTLNSIWTLTGTNVSNNTGKSIDLLTKNKTAMSIDSNGNIGMGGINKTSKLFIKQGTTSSTFDSTVYMPVIISEHILNDSSVAYNGTSQVANVGQKIVVRKNFNLNVGSLIDVGTINTNSSIYPANYGSYTTVQSKSINGYSLGAIAVASNALNNRGGYFGASNSHDSINGSNTGLRTTAQGVGNYNIGIDNNVQGRTKYQRATGIYNSLYTYGRYADITGLYSDIRMYERSSRADGIYSYIESTKDSISASGTYSGLRFSGNTTYAHINYSYLYLDGKNSTGFGTRSDIRLDEVNSRGVGYDQYIGLSGDNSNCDGIAMDVRSYAKNTQTYGINVYASGSNNSDLNYGIYSRAQNGATNYAGYFVGDVHVSGALSKSSGSFKIDHPSDPENKYLVHSFVESPDMMNIYNGNIVTDGNGTAIVTMPDYFEILNMDFRYQLTCIGEFAQAIVFQKMEGNKFIIKTDKPNIEVSWQVTGVRQDPWANKHRIVPVVTKSPTEKGTYLNPELYGQPETKGLGYKEPQTVPERKEKKAGPPKTKMPAVKGFE